MHPLTVSLRCLSTITAGGMQQIMRSLFAALPFVLALLLPVSQAKAQTQMSPEVQRGVAFARLHCARCHSIDKVSPCPLPVAPPFRTLHNRYPVENLQEALAEGIVTGHPSMPQFQLPPDRIGDLIAFLKTLEE